MVIQLNNNRNHRDGSDQESDHVREAENELNHVSEAEGDSSSDGHKSNLERLVHHNKSLDQVEVQMDGTALGLLRTGRKRTQRRRDPGWEKL